MRPLHQNGSKCQQAPFQAIFCHSSALHPMVSFACLVSSVQLNLACVLQQSSLCCALPAQTASSYWCEAPHPTPMDAKLRKKGLCDNLILCLHITDPMDHYAVIMPKAVLCNNCNGPSVCCMQHHTPHAC